MWNTSVYVGWPALLVVLFLQSFWLCRIMLIQVQNGGGVPYYLGTIMCNYVTNIINYFTIEILGEQ